jgi:hypothetical protein
MSCQALSVYNEFVRKYSGEFKAQVSKEQLAPAALELDSLLTVASKTDKLSYNPAHLYDSLSNMKSLAVRVGKMEMCSSAVTAMDQVGGETTPEDANSHLLDYFEMSSLPNLLTKLCDTINQNFNSASPDELVTLTEPISQEMQDLVSSALNKLKGISSIFDSIGQQIKNAINDFKNIIKEKVAPKIIEFVKKIADLYQKLQWKLMEPYLNFANAIIDHAKKKNWNLKEIWVSVPEWNANTINLLGLNIPIPIPSVKSSIVFTPSLHSS